MRVRKCLRVGRKGLTKLERFGILPKVWKVIKKRFAKFIKVW